MGNKPSNERLLLMKLILRNPTLTLKYRGEDCRTSCVEYGKLHIHFNKNKLTATLDHAVGTYPSAAIFTPRWASISSAELLFEHSGRGRRLIVSLKYVAKDYLTAVVMRKRKGNLYGTTQYLHVHL